MTDSPRTRIVFQFGDYTLLKKITYKRHCKKCGTEVYQPPTFENPYGFWYCPKCDIHYGFELTEVGEGN